MNIEVLAAIVEVLAAIALVLVLVVYIEIKMHLHHLTFKQELDNQAHQTEAAAKAEIAKLADKLDEHIDKTESAPTSSVPPAAGA